MIAHILYRNKKFKESLEYLVLFKKDIAKYGKSYSRKFYPRYLLLYATVQNIEGNVVESIRVLEEALTIYEDILSIQDVLNMKINLGVYYFELEKYKESNKIIYSIENSDKWLEKKMGKEWILRKNLGEILNLYERGNVEIAMNRIKSFEKQHAAFLKMPIYKRVSTFLTFIKVCIDKPYWISSKEFNHSVNETLERWPIDQEDLIASSFYCWLKSKMLKKPFYYVMVETLQGRL
jgi:tetratricopeptide (TPR) repeat protein